MRLLKSSAIFSLATILSAQFIACDAVSSSQSEYEKDYTKYGAPNEDFSNRPIEMAEFEMNYMMLDLFYLYAHTRNELKNKGEYYKKAEGTIFATKSFSDTYYLYNQMSCPFTNYYDPELTEYVESQLFYSERNVGFGFSLDTINQEPTDKPVISEVFPNSPAEKAGLQSGDTILYIDNSLAILNTIQQKEESAKKGSTFEFSVKRQDSTFSTEVKASEVVYPTVYTTYKGDVPVITITEFTDTTITSEGTYGEFMKALEKTKDSKATVINLADNGGGSVDHCMPMAAQLLPKGSVLGYSIEAALDSSRRGYRQRIDTNKVLPSDYNVTEDGVAKDRYIVFVQDRNTASCSELMISAVAASKNTPVVGTQSYGKGIAQIYFGTLAEGIAGVTTAQLYDKNMVSYHSYGIQPDFVIKDHREALMKAIEIAEKGVYQRTEGYSTKPSGNFSTTLSRASAEKVRNPREFFGAFKKIEVPEFIKH